MISHLHSKISSPVQEQKLPGSQENTTSAFDLPTLVQELAGLSEAGERWQYWNEKVNYVEEALEMDDSELIYKEMSDISFNSLSASLTSSCF